MPKITDPALLAQLGAGGGPTIPGTGPKPPSGYQAVPGGLAPIAGGPEDPKASVAKITAEALARVRATTPVEVSGQIQAAQARTQLDLVADAIKRQREQAAADRARALKQADAVRAAQGLTGDARNQALQKIEALKALNRQADVVAREFNRSQNGRGPLQSVGELLPGMISPDNARFDAAVDGLTPLARAAFRVPGSGSDSDKESDAFMGLLPGRWTSDAGNAQRINQMRSMIRDGVMGQQRLLGVRSADPAPASKKPDISGFKVIR